MEVMTPLSKDDPRMIAWTEFLSSEEYDNAFKWAVVEEHRKGSLWAAFIAGYAASRKVTK